MATEREADGSKPRRRRRWLARICRHLNSPLFVTLFGGVLVLLISTFVQDRYWVAQQDYLLRQSRRSHKIDAASTTQEEVIQAMGRRLTGIAVLIAAHEEHFQKKQYEEKRSEYEKSRDDWDNVEEVLKLKVGFYYDAKVNKSWSDLRTDFLALDTIVMEKLEKWDTESTKAEHLNLTTQARQTLEKVTDGLDQLAGQMNEYIEKQESSP
jgi:hypothetical protein